MTAEDHLRELLRTALNSLKSEKVLPADGPAEIALDRPAQAEHGDYATNLPLVLAKQARMAPAELAKIIVSKLPGSERIDRTEIAGPGFINFFLSTAALHRAVRQISNEKDHYGKAADGGQKIQIEFVSANPTGPLHVGSGRNAAYGDALARVLEAAGHSVTREYYINDAGKQIDRFTESVLARYLQALGREAEVPEDGYHGEYLIDLGKQLAEQKGDSLTGDPASIAAWALVRMVESHRKVLETMGIRFDNWFFESALHEQGKVAAGLKRLEEGGHIYEQEGALWFRATGQGAPRDQVLVRSDDRRTPTYLGVDVAYLLDKLERGFDKVIYVWGADHHGNVAGLMAVARALRVESSVEILLHQMVNLMTQGAAEKMSKRSGNIVALQEVLEEVGPDAARFTFLSRSIDQTIDFDLKVLKAQSDENPVYYVQYQHARACSILRKAAEQGSTPTSDADLALLAHPSEETLMKKLAAYPEVVAEGAALRAPHRLVHFSQALAAGFSAFHRDCRVLTAEPQLQSARLELVDATRQVLANNLSLLGVSAPEKM